MKTTRRFILVSGLTLALAVSGAGIRIAHAASESHARTVQGEVVAVNVSDSSHVIVVKVGKTPKKELIVGATVESGVTITRGKQQISLDNLKVGETVSLTYVKNPDGLTARSIQAR